MAKKIKMGGLKQVSAVLFEKKDTYAIATLNRPESRNAINIEIIEKLEALLDDVAVDPRVRSVILTGGEKYFCAGADIKSRVQEGEDPSYTKISPDGDPFTFRFRHLLNQMEQMGKCFIAAVSGYAVGGGMELALACDLRYASETAVFGLAEPKVGSIPGAGGTQRLIRIIGLGRAKEMLFTANFIKAEEANLAGLVNKVVSADRLLAAAEEVAKLIGERAPLSISFIKKSVYTGLQSGLEVGLMYESLCHSLIRNSADYKDGMKAFVEKRKPVFKGF